MIQFALQTLVMAAVLFMVGRIVTDIEVEDGRTALFGALGLSMANHFIRPLLLKLSLPITFLTFGLFFWVINALLLMLVASFIDGFEVKGFKAALSGSALIGIFGFLAKLILPFV